MADLKFTVTIPEAYKERFIDGIAGDFGYKPDNEQGETKAQYGRRKILQELKMKVLNYERRVKRDAVTDDPFDVT